MKAFDYSVILQKTEQNKAILVVEDCQWVSLTQYPVDICKLFHPCVKSIIYFIQGLHLYFAFVVLVVHETVRLTHNASVAQTYFVFQS